MFKHFLILGHHRSGTNFLNNIIQYHSQAECINEPLSMHCEFFRDRDLEIWGGNDFDDNILHRDLLNTPELVTFLKDLNAWLTCPLKKQARGFKETILFDKLEWLKQFMPDLKILYLIRDPRAVIYSILKKNVHNSLWQYSEKVPAFTKEHYGFNKFHEQVSLIAWSWKIRYKMARDWLGNFDFCCIKLEDILEFPEMSINNIMNFIGLSSEETQLNQLSQYILTTRGKHYSSFRTKESVLNSWENNLSPAEIRLINEILNEELNANRYKE